MLDKDFSGRGGKSFFFQNVLILGCETEKGHLIPNSLLSVKYDSNGRKIGFFFNENEFKNENDLSIDKTYNIKIQQERKSNGAYVLSVKQDGTKIFDFVNLNVYVLPQASVYFFNNEESSLESATIVENVSIIKGNLDFLIFFLHDSAKNLFSLKDNRGKTTILTKYPYYNLKQKIFIIPKYNFDQQQF